VLASTLMTNLVWSRLRHRDHVQEQLEGLIGSDQRSQLERFGPESVRTIGEILSERVGQALVIAHRVAELGLTAEATASRRDGLTGLDAAPGELRAAGDRFCGAPVARITRIR